MAKKALTHRTYANAEKYSAARVSLARRPEILDFPELTELQTESYRWFLSQGIAELLEEVSPVMDFQAEKFELRFVSYDIGTPKYDEENCAIKGLTYEAPLNIRTQLLNKQTGEVKEQEVYMGAIPLMTPRGTFVISGIERVVVSQIVRSSGVFFAKSDTFTGKYNLKLIPNRGAWIEVESERGNVFVLKIDRKRKMYLTTFLRALGYDTDQQILDLFKDLLTDIENNPILATLEKDPTKNTNEALQFVYKKIRPGDLATPENARSLLEQMFFDYRHYDLGRVGRYKLNQRLGLDLPEARDNQVFRVDDFVAMIRELLVLNASGGSAPEDDIDSLSNRRVKPVGEQVQNKFRVGLLRVERIIRDRMSTLDPDTLLPQQLINAHPIVASLREFFATSQMSQFMDQVNPIAELAHKRRLSALGPGGLTRERASLEARDLHPSHYGRICPIETPVGPTIGLVLQLGSFARVNEYGFIETPFRSVQKYVPNTVENLLGRELIHGLEYDGTIIAEDGTIVDESLAKKIAKLPLTEIRVRPFLTNEVSYYSAYDEQKMVIAPFSVELNEKNEFCDRRVTVRANGDARMEHIDNVTHMDVSSMQVFSTDTGLIPFLEHDDNVRASYGSTQQRQAVSVIRPRAPLVGTGLEHIAAKSSGQVVIAEAEGEVVEVDSSKIVIVTDDGRKMTYRLRSFLRSNAGTLLHQKPIVCVGDAVAHNQVIAEGPGVDGDELAIGQDLLVAYMPFYGYNFEDAIALSEDVSRRGLFDSVHIEEYIMDLRDTKLGPEQFTRDIPNVGQERLKNLDENGYIAIGSEVGVGDILVGKITPKGETETTPEEKLLRAIFGDKVSDVKDTSLRVSSGEKGKVISVREFTRRDGSELPTGVMKRVVVSVAKIKRISVGDKMAGRHGDKGVVSRIVPLEDMPFTEDGTPMDIVLNPLGVISRMNIGQLLETHLGLIAHRKGVKYSTPVLNGVTAEKIRELYVEIGMAEDGKMQLFDGTTGEPFAQRTIVGYKYTLKLHHIVEDKMHARSVGPYSLVTQQPLGGKAQNGGQRFGEMEVWALEAYGAAHTLQEMLTIKSDDVQGRSSAYESIIKGHSPENPSIPESFHVLVKELQSCGLNVEFLSSVGAVVNIHDLEKKFEENLIKGDHYHISDDVLNKVDDLS